MWILHPPPLVNKATHSGMKEWSIIGGGGKKRCIGISNIFVAFPLYNTKSEGYIVIPPWRYFSQSFPNIQHPTLLLLLCTSQCESPESPHKQTQAILTFENFLLSKSPPSFAPLVSESPLFPTPGGGNLFILNVRSALGSEHLSKPPGWDSRTVRIPWVAHAPPPRIHTDWCITHTHYYCYYYYY